jgi:hypothetical protein
MNPIPPDTAVETIHMTGYVLESLNQFFFKKDEKRILLFVHYVFNSPS